MLEASLLSTNADGVATISFFFSRLFDLVSGLFLAVLPLIVELLLVKGLGPLRSKACELVAFDGLGNGDGDRGFGADSVLSGRLTGDGGFTSVGFLTVDFALVVDLGAVDLVAEIEDFDLR